jgi:hypothetical protein
MENIKRNNGFQNGNPRVRLDVASPRMARLPTRVRRFVRPGKVSTPDKSWLILNPSI